MNNHILHYLLLKHYMRPLVTPVKPRKPSGTKVIFRTFKRGDVIAIFPEVPGDYDPATCSSYQTIGQHGACDPSGLMGITKPTAPKDYADLVKELRGIGYNLKIIKRNSSSFYRLRQQAIKNEG